MTSPKTALEASGLKPPVRPSAEDEAEIVRSFELSADQAHELHLTIGHFIEDVSGYLAELARIPPRSERANRLRRIEKALRRVQYEVQTSGDLLDHLLPFELSEKLGCKLTFAAIGEAVGSPQEPVNFEGAAQDIIAREGRLSMQALEATFAYKRRALGLAHGGAIFRSMIDDLYVPLGRWVELDKKKSGAKPKQFRNLVIGRLAEASQDILGTEATGTANGRFVRLCAAVLNAMKIPSRGVEKAVETVLKQRRADACQPT